LDIKDLLVFLDSWIKIDSLFINQLLTQRCGAFQTCTRALLPFYRSVVITAELVKSAIFINDNYDVQIRSFTILSIKKDDCFDI
jgi:hypothetical protein